MLFKIASPKDREDLWKFEKILAKDQRAYLLLKRDKKTHRHVLRLKGEKRWLVTRNNDNSELPDSTTRNSRNLCLRLVRVKP